MPETSILKVLADNPALFEATKKALLEEFEEVEVMVDSDRSDTQLGQMYRARIVGVQVVEAVFKRIAKLKAGTPSEPRVAKHR